MPRRWALFIFVLFAVLLLAFTFRVSAAPSVTLTISFIDVGQGDSALLRDSSGFDVLIDGGKPIAGPTVVAYLREQGIDDKVSLGQVVDTLIYLPLVLHNRLAPPTGTPIPTSTVPPALTQTQVPGPTQTPTPTQSPSPTPSTPSSPARVSITTIFYNGNKGSQEPDEYVEIRNDDTQSIQLQGWTLRDNAAEPKVFTFPNFLMQPGQVCRVYTNEIHPEFCGFSFGNSAAIWNNNGDCAYLQDGQGNLVDDYCY